MTRLLHSLVLALIVVLLLVPAIPAGAQTQDPATGTGPSVSVTVLPYVGLWGGDFVLGSIDNQVYHSIYDQAGNGSSSSSLSSNVLAVNPGHHPMAIFAAESGPIKNGIGFGGSGWNYSSNAAVAGNIKPFVDTSQGNNTNVNSDSLSTMGQTISANGGQQYGATSAWNIQNGEVGLIWYSTLPKGTVKLFTGVAYAHVENSTTITQASTSSNSYTSQDGSYSSFSHDEESANASAKFDFKGFGPRLGGTVNTHLGRVAIESNLNLAVLFGEEKGSGNFEFNDESFSSSSYQDTSMPSLTQNSSSHNFNTMTSPYSTVSKIVVEMIEMQISAGVNLGKFELKAGIFVEAIKGLSGVANVNYSSWSDGQPITPVLAGGTGTITYRWGK